MRAVDFEFDGKTLSSFGMIICSFDSKGLETISNGSEISFNTVPTLDGSKFELTSTQYENCLESTIQICKNVCSGGALEIKPHEFRELTKWLNRKKFLKLKFLSDEYIDIYYEASFNIGRIEIDGRLIGLELQILTNRPFALKEPKIITIENTIESGNLKRMYNWEKYTFEYNTSESLMEDVVVFRLSDSGEDQSGIYVDYAGMILVSKDGISLMNPTKSNEFSVIVDAIKGKFVYSSYTNKFYRVPSTSEVEYHAGRYYGEVRVSEIYEITFNITLNDCIEEVHSENIDEYPMDGIQDNADIGCYYYIYTGKNFPVVKKCSIYDTSHEEGHIYPYTEITIVEDGDLNIHCDLEDRDTYIANCKAGEIITMDYPIIQSSMDSHNIQNDFNWNFFRIANTYEKSRNDLAISLPCTIKIKYSPIIKVGL